VKITDKIIVREEGSLFTEIGGIGIQKEVFERIPIDDRRWIIIRRYLEKT